MTLREAFNDRILLLDGAMGSLLMKGNNDYLSLTDPDAILDIHRRYIAAGADVITTNTFSSQRVSQHEYHLEDRVEDMNRAAVRLARQAASEVKDRKVYILGDVGPTSKMLSMSEDVNDPAARSITFDELEAAYLEQIQILVEEGVDGILLETIFDTLNAKAGISACLKAGAPEILLSMTVSDASGRTLSGQTVEAFVTSVLHANPLCIGLNCGLGADRMLPYLRQMASFAPTFVSCHPNAGMPNQFGAYEDTPEEMVRQMTPYLEEHLVNMIGGCCGTTPAHIAAFREMLDLLPNAYEKRMPKPRKGVQPLLLSGLTVLRADAKTFVKVGERCNVAGSRKFLKLISAKQYDEALEIARKQVEDGAMVIDINMDDGLLDARQEVQTFLNLLASDPAISNVPIMVDSSRFEVIEAGLKCCQGKGIVNSISLKMGEKDFVEKARIVKSLGAAVIAMCFDEEGQATDYKRRIRICQRMYKLLTEQAGFAPEDIIFDPNVLTIATGMAEHAAYAQDFIRATRWVTENLPGTRVSGGLSNLSFAFRGNNYLRESMHSVFLHHAIANGMGMAIMNPATAVQYKTIPLELRMAITEVILNTSSDACEELIALAQKMNEAQAQAKEAGLKYDPKALFSGSVQPVEKKSADSGTVRVTQNPALDTPELRLQDALLKGTTTTLDTDLKELLARGDSPLAIISGPLMSGMNEVGRLFGEGKMFLPQVVKTARTMKKAVEILDPYIKNEQSSDTQKAPSSRGRILIATVKGDVHDIGKNIVGVILACNGFEVIDLGVMVPVEKILEAIHEQHIDIVCLSGLITPSLEEMCVVARAMQKEGLDIPLIVGGATTSPVHTAVKIAPCYEGPVFHVRDAASNPGLAMKLLDPASREQVVASNRAEQERIRQQQNQRQLRDKFNEQTSRTLGTALPLERRLKVDWSRYPEVNPPFYGAKVLPPILVRDLIPYIDWLYFYWAWRVKEDSEEGRKLRKDADNILAQIAEGQEYAVRVTQAFYPAVGLEDRIRVTLRRNGHDLNCPCCNQTLDIPTPRQQKDQGTCLSLCDYVNDCIGAFACTVSEKFVQRLENLKQTHGGSDYDVLLLQTVGDRLAEAASEYLAQKLKVENQWGGIRPAVGYPSLPDQKSIFLLAKMIEYDAIGIRLTENGAMYPQASVSGLYISYPDAEYFSVKNP
jgi:5-methyltetrahydrofolate--homocysteine methyltransferase